MMLMAQRTNLSMSRNQKGREKAKRLVRFYLLISLEKDNSNLMKEESPLVDSGDEIASEDEKQVVSQKPARKGVQLRSRTQGRAKTPQQLSSLTSDEKARDLESEAAKQEQRESAKQEERGEDLSPEPEVELNKSKRPKRKVAPKKVKTNKNAKSKK
jgi:hypothetical protein